LARTEWTCMIEFVRTLLESSPLLALFLTIAAGYAIGQISIAGVSFGAGAVLFTGRPSGRGTEISAARNGRHPRPHDVRLWGRHAYGPQFFRVTAGLASST
jgi:hypothetical protein